jgi:predicted dithiol-disulfide oxidoreductase (DUF899 family)
MATQVDPIQSPRVVSPQQWVSERVALLAREKELTRLRDEVSRQRRELPWEEVTTAYVFDGPDGKATLADLFGRRSQLIVYHFMFDPAWDGGCKSCSFVADNLSGALLHLGARDTAFAAISRAPLDKIQRFKQRMGWSFPWLSSFGTEFNHDFRVTIDESHTEYNYAPVTAQPAGRPHKGEREGLSVFVRDGERVFHTYSTYQRGLDPLLETYNLLDLTPRGRHEGGRPMAWVRYHDQYED